jgi:DNA-binding HxlR family transcriptional regulator
MDIECDPIYAKVDKLLEVLTKSKSLHILLILHEARDSLSFTKLKSSVDSSGTTVSRRLNELEQYGLVKREVSDSKSISYGLTEKSESLAPIVQSMYDWCRTNQRQ